VTQTINVTAEVPLLKSERTDVATTLSEKAVMDLPTINRNFTELILLTPGSIQFNWNDTSTENPQGGIAINVNGQHFTGLGYLLDGPITGFHVRQHARGSDLIQCTGKSHQSNFDAEFGQAQAGVVTTSTKIGYQRVPWQRVHVPAQRSDGGRDPFRSPFRCERQVASPKPLEPVRRIRQIIFKQDFFFGDYRGTPAKNAGSQILAPLRLSEMVI
jgi:hypothetical protein